MAVQMHPLAYVLLALTVVSLYFAVKTYVPQQP